jgi:hypothetical protein
LYCVLRYILYRQVISKRGVAQMTSRNEMIELCKANTAAWDKFHFNAGKVRFLSYTKAGVHAYEQYGDQLEAMKVAAEEARKVFTEAVASLPGEEVASLVIEAMSLKVAA